MNDQANDQALDLTILEALHASGSMLMSHNTLLQHVRIAASPKPLTSEIALRIRALDGKGLLVSVPAAYGYKYKLSDEGRAFWKEHGE